MSRSGVAGGALLPAVHTPGYLLAWDLATSKYVEVAPTGVSELGVGSNNTGVAQAVTTVSTDLTGLTIDIAASGGRPVWLSVYAAAQQTTVGAGIALLALYDMTAGGAGVFICNFFGPLPNSIGTYSKYFSISGSIPMGVLAAPKSYKVQVQVLQDTASAAAFSVLNGSSASPPSFLAAAAR